MRNVAISDVSHPTSERTPDGKTRRALLHYLGHGTNRTESAQVSTNVDK